MALWWVAVRRSSDLFLMYRKENMLFVPSSRKAHKMILSICLFCLRLGHLGTRTDR